MPIRLVRDFFEDEGKKTGEHCSDAKECLSGLCANNVCNDCSPKNSNCPEGQTCINDMSQNGASICLPSIDFDLFRWDCNNIRDRLLVAHPLYDLARGIDNCDETIGAILDGCAAACNHILTAQSLFDALPLNHHPDITADDCRIFGNDPFDLNQEFNHLKELSASHCPCDNECNCTMPLAPIGTK